MNKQDIKEMEYGLKQMPAVINAAAKMMTSPAGKKTIKSYVSAFIKILECIPRKDIKRIKQLTS